MPAFHEVLFPDTLAEGARGGPGFATVVIASASGAEQRVGQWSEARRSWDVSQALRNNTQRDALIAFFVARMGRLYGFRFRDPLDNAVTTPTSLEVVDATHYRLQKRYTSGGITHDRRITKPVGDTLSNTSATQADSTVTLYQTDGTTEITNGWTVDLTTGIVTFTSDPGFTPKATFEFHVPVRFDTDELEYEQTSVTYGSWSQVPLVEVRS